MGPDSARSAVGSAKLETGIQRLLDIQPAKCIGVCPSLLRACQPPKPPSASQTT
jgi:hypothetical protein